jgi:NAD(P)-dependent dehydrogenase (short-subunit alcohol dehydrogenase family)
MGRFNDKVVLVTGAGSGIGQAAALAYAHEGARVVVADINEDLGGATERLIDRNGGDATFVACDVSNAAQVQAMVKAAVSAYGKLDVAFNNAGISGPQVHTAEYDEDDFDRVIAVNLRGAFLCMKHEIAQMLNQDHGGTIVNNASILGMVGFASAAPYVAAEHGLIGLTRTAALEYATRRVRVNAVCPGFIDTPMLTRAGLTGKPELRAAVEGIHPMKRLGTAEEIAAVALWLSSDESSLLTGVALPADGGYLAQ